MNKTNSFLTYYTSLIAEKLVAAGLDRSEIEDTVKLLDRVIYEQVVTDLLGELSEDQLDKLDQLVQGSAPDKQIADVLKMDEEQFTKHVLEYLETYLKNLESSLPTLSETIKEIKSN